MADGGTPEQAMDEALDAVHAALQDDARSWARQLRATARLVDAARATGGADRAVVELEIAGSCSVGQTTATRLMIEAEHLTTCLPATLACLGAGALLVHQARVLLQVTRACTPAVAQQVEREVLVAGGADLCPADLRALVTRLLRLEHEAVDQDTAEQRQQAAAAQRRTWPRADSDGMGVAGAVLTAEQLVTWNAGLDALEAQERASDREAGIDRTADQRRADLFAALPALVLAAREADPAAAGSPQVRPQVVLFVHVPMATVLGLSHEPGHLDGYGPVSAAHVRLLRPTAYRRVLVDAGTGRPVSLDDHLTPLPDDGHESWQALRAQLRDSLVPTVVADRAEAQHDPSARLARLVDVRDRRCSGPGCGQTRTHRDHVVPWPAGPTAAWNLQRLSARCHRAKHAGWTQQRRDDGSVTWHSPLGRTYRRPSPHGPPPRVDLHRESPPVRPPPRPPRPVTDAHPGVHHVRPVDARPGADAAARRTALLTSVEVAVVTRAQVGSEIATTRRSESLPARWFDLVRLALRLLGPATPKLVAGYLEAPVKDVERRWPQDVVDVRVEGEVRQVLAQDAAALDDGPVRGTRLLGPYDLFLQVRDRTLLVDGPARTKQVWPVLGRPGVVLADGAVAGTWRPRKAGKGLTVAVDLWQPVQGVDEQAERLAAVRGVRLSRVEAQR